MAKKMNLLDLPPELLLLILTKSDHKHRSNLALVSQSLRSITDGFIHSLIFNALPSDSDFHKLFTRFTSVTRIVIKFRDQIDSALIAISKSRLRIEALEFVGYVYIPTPHQLINLSGEFGMVKILRLECCGNTVDLHVVGFIAMFPSLEELDLSYYWKSSYAGMKKLVSNAPNLRKIRFTFECNLTDQSLDALATCVNLKHISFFGCGHMTVKGFRKFIHKRNDLKSLDMPSYYKSTMVDDDIQALAETISFCKNLNHLLIDCALLGDTSLKILAKTRSPLTSLAIIMLPYIYANRSHRYSVEGLAAIIHGFPGLTQLTICHTSSQMGSLDMEMSRLVKSLPKLKYFDLSSSDCAPYATMFSLIQNCPLLEEIIIFVFGTTTCVCDCELPLPQIFRKNCSVQRIDFYPNVDSRVKMVVESMCPSLKKWS